ncbi:hypothetical protein TNCV_1492491 [Trichonephila clavipes]|nr:hypothetical protein TNCV_1492491 [Trichonephila clavipes]
MEVSQAMEKVLVFKSEQVQMLRADPDAVAQPVAVEGKKGLSNVSLISAEDETYEEKKETPVDDKGEIEKLAWKLPDFIKQIGIMKVRQSFREREDQKTTKVKMKNGVMRKLRKSEIEFQKRGFKRRAKSKVTIRGDR